MIMSRWPTWMLEISSQAATNLPSVIVTICSAPSLYNAVELILLIFTTFNAYLGLYFWSLLVASCGVIPYTIGLLFEYFQLTSLTGGLVIDNIGWRTMITGQSVVLYSRLGNSARQRS